MKLTSLLLLATVLNVFVNKTFSHYPRLSLDVEVVPSQVVPGTIEGQSEFFSLPDFIFQQRQITGKVTGSDNAPHEKLRLSADLNSLFPMIQTEWTDHYKGTRAGS